jgi:aconitate hydratase
VPPATGIVHQVNLEYLAKVSCSRDATACCTRQLVGTDSHTTMINGLGVVGWGVGGIEAEAVMLGQPIYMLMPEVVGFKLTGAAARRRHRHRPGAAPSREMLRKHGVVGKFVEFFGEGLAAVVADRATIANMAPEYGATIGFFPVDERRSTTCASPAATKTIDPSSATARNRAVARRPRADPEYTAAAATRPGTVEPSLAGPKRPQDRID